MWHGISPALTTKFTSDGKLDHAEMERCLLGEGSMPVLEV